MPTGYQLHAINEPRLLLGRSLRRNAYSRRSTRFVGRAHSCHCSQSLFVLKFEADRITLHFGDDCGALVVCLVDRQWSTSLLYLKYLYTC